jgi:hypothetical protein
MTARGLHSLVTSAVASSVLASAAPALATADSRNEWLGLDQSMAAPWVKVQRSDGSFTDYVVDAAPKGPPRDPYGRSFMGLALLQAGLRDGDRPQVGVALRAIGAAAAHPVRRDRIVFENLALATAYNVARAKLAGDSRFKAIRPALETRLKHMTVVQFGGSRPYYNYYLVDSAGLMELLSSGLTSSVPGSALANRARTKRLIVDLVNRRVPGIASRYATRDAAGELEVLSDPPWNPPAYDAFSLALMARIVNRLGPSASKGARSAMRGIARSLWVLASPEGSVSYFGRSQDQSWTLAMTAYGALAAADLPQTSAADIARFQVLAARVLMRLRDAYAGGRFGFWITPAFGHGKVRAAIPGLDRYADAASYSGLTLVGLNWALEQMDADGPAPGPLAADTPGVHRIGVGDGAVVTVRTPSLWFAVKQGPGTYVKGIGDYSGDVRYDSGLVALQSIAPDGTPANVLPLRPHSLGRGDRAEPELARGHLAARFWGTSLRTTGSSGVVLTGGYRAGKRWLRRRVAIRYDVQGCGLTESLPTHRGDRVQQALWFRGRPQTTGGGRVLTDARQRVALSVRPRRIVQRGGYASGTEQRLTMVELLFRGTGKPLIFSFCPRSAA